MPVVRYKPGGAAVTVSDAQVDKYVAKGWAVDKPKSKPTRRKTAADEDD